MYRDLNIDGDANQRDDKKRLHASLKNDGCSRPNFYNTLIQKQNSSTREPWFLSIHDSHACRGGISVLTVPEWRRPMAVEAMTERLKGQTCGV